MYFILNKVFLLINQIARKLSTVQIVRAMLLPVSNSEKLTRISTIRKFLMLTYSVRNRIYTTDTLSVAEHLFAHSTIPIVNCSAYDFFVTYYGVQNKYAGELEQRLRDGAFINSLTSFQRVKLIPSLLANDKLEVADDIIQDSDIYFLKAKGNYLSIANRLSRCCAASGSMAEFELAADMFSRIKENQNRLTSILRDPSLRVCIVGNAPSEKGTCNGKLIDSYDVVIRFNNYSLEYPADYGTKETIWVRVPNDEIVKKHYEQNAFCIFASYNYEYKRVNAAFQMREAYDSNGGISLVPNEIFTVLIQKLGGLPSTGLLIIYWLSTLRKVSRSDIFGFSHFSSRANFKDHYFTLKNKPKIHIHEWQKEVSIVNSIVSDQ